MANKELMNIVTNMFQQFENAGIEKTSQANLFRNLAHFL